jgi:hypothetical protein
MFNYLACENYYKGRITKKIFERLIGHIEILSALGNDYANKDVFDLINKLSELKPKDRRGYYSIVFGNTEIYEKINKPLSDDLRDFLQKTGFPERRFYEIFEDFVLVGISDNSEEIKQRILKISKLPKHGVTREKMMLRYGDLVGECRWKSYCNKQQKCGCSLDYFVMKYGKDQGKRRYSEVSASKVITLEKSIQRHGEISGKRIFEAYCKKQAFNGNSLQYFVLKYGEDLGRQRYDRVCQQKRITRENFIRKYGDFDGNIRYERWKNGIINRPTHKHSIISQKFFLDAL